MTVAWPLTVYYDASCPLCREELHALAAHDVDGRLRLHDIAVADGVDADCRAAGLDHRTLLAAIHARADDGTWYRGVAVFELAYGAAGLAGIARMFGHPRLRPLWDRLYPWVARNRHRLSRLRLNRPYGWIVGRMAARAQRRAAACARGTCAAPAGGRTRDA